MSIYRGISALRAESPPIFENPDLPGSWWREDAGVRGLVGFILSCRLHGRTVVSRGRIFILSYQFQDGRSVAVGSWGTGCYQLSKQAVIVGTGGCSLSEQAVVEQRQPRGWLAMNCNFCFLWLLFCDFCLVWFLFCDFCFVISVLCFVISVLWFLFSDFCFPSFSFLFSDFWFLWKKANAVMLAFVCRSLYIANENERLNFGVHLSSSYFLCNKSQNERQDLRQNLKLLLSTKPCADIWTKWLWQAAQSWRSFVDHYILQKFGVRSTITFCCKNWVEKQTSQSCR